MEKANSFFSVVFIFEMPIKLCAIGFKNYFTDFFNFFDAFIVATSLADILMTNLTVEFNLGAVTAMRTFRLLRLFKLAKTWKSLNNLLTTMVQTLIDISQFSIILFLFMYVYSLLGMELFAYKAKFDEDGNISEDEDANPIQTNFDSFLWAFTTVFILLTEDNWSYIYYAYHRAYSNWRATLYF
jgi:voltage-dependent calcium channel L type alpha-1D